LFFRDWLLKVGVLVLSLWLTLALVGCGGGDNPGQQGDEAAKPEGTSTQTQLQESPREGYLAPGFTLPDLTGKPTSLSDFRGKVVLVNIWATWCGPCKREIPSLDRLYQLRKDKGFEIVAVSEDRTSSSKVASFVADYQMSFPVLHDARGEVGNKYWARAIPSSFLLDRQGVIRWKVAGAIQWDDDRVVKRVDQLLAQE
jgi:peroxiredoxin